MIPGGGGAAGIGAIKSLKICKFKGKTVSTDSDVLSAGIYLADRGYIVPLADNPFFLKRAMKIMEREQIDIILPTSGFDIVSYSKNKKMLRENDIIAAMSDYDTIETCLNKIKFYLKLKNKFNLPYTTTDPLKIDAFPCIVKPIFGKGSKDIFICYDENELKKVLLNKNGMLIQEYLPEKEYTIDVLSDLDGNSLIAIPRERIEVKSGISFKGRVILDKTMQEECLSIAEHLEIKGPSCMQMKCNKDHEPRIMEVNPRMGGGTIMTTYAGLNIPDILIKIANDKKIEIPQVKEITMVRYYEEVILNEYGEKT